MKIKRWLKSLLFTKEEKYLIHLGRAVMAIPWNAKLSHEPLNNTAGFGFKWILEIPGDGIVEAQDPLTALTIHKVVLNGPVPPQEMSHE